MNKVLLETSFISDILSSKTQNDPQKYFYCGYLYSKYQLTLSKDIQTVLDIIDKLNQLLITAKQKNNILQKLSAHQVQEFTISDMEKTISQYVDEVVPHLQLALELEKTRKLSQLVQEIEPANAQNDKNKNGTELLECKICLQVIKSSNSITLECSHCFHKECVTKSFEYKIDSNILPLICPQDQCLKQVSNKDMIECVSRQYQEKHQNFLFKKFVSNNYDTMCWCPTIGCEYVFCFGVGQSAFVCPICSKFYCLNCRSQYHVGMSCREFSRSKNIPQADEKFYEFAEGARYKQCPKCKFWVEKSEGCHHMVCRCDFEFCYTCGEEYPNCGCNSQQQTQRAQLALQIATEQLRNISQGLRQHQRQLLRLQRRELMQVQGEFRTDFQETILVINDEEPRPKQEQPQVIMEKQKQPQLVNEPQTLSSYRRIEQGKIHKNALSTSVQSNGKKAQISNLFQTKKQEQKQILKNRTFHTSPTVRKIFRGNNLQQGVQKHHNPIQNKRFLNSQRFEYQKSLPSTSKPIQKRLQRPIYHQLNLNQKLVFSQGTERKKSYTKY